MISCELCKQAFTEEDDDIIISTIRGKGKDYLHQDCHLDWLLICDDYMFVSYQKLLTTSNTVNLLCEKSR